MRNGKQRFLTGVLALFFLATCAGNAMAGKPCNISSPWRLSYNPGRHQCGEQYGVYYHGVGWYLCGEHQLSGQGHHGYF